MREELRIWLNDFLGYIQDVRGYSVTTVTTYEVALRQMLETSECFLEGERWIMDISAFRLKIARNAKKTIVKKISAIHTFVRYLQEQRGISVKLIGDESVKAPTTLPKPVEELSIREVLEEAGLREKLLVTMLYGLGLRISELSTLKLKCIRSGWVEIEGKGGRVRQLPLLPELESLIAAYRERYGPVHHLFEKEGAAMSSAQLRYLLGKLFRERGLKVTPHQLRHSFATHLLNNGARISDVSELLGHASMATTQIYTKLGESRKLEAYLDAHPLAQKK